MTPIAKRSKVTTLVLLVLAIPTVAIAGSVLTPPASVTGASTGPIFTATNTGSGLAIEGIGQGATGILGETLFNSSSGTNFRAGTSGTDASTSGSFNSGVYGKSKRGTGVSGVSTSGTGVSASSTSGDGVVAITSTATGIALFGNNTATTGGTAIEGSSAGNAIQGISKIANGVVGSTKNTSTSRVAAGIAGVDQGTAATNAGLRGTSTSGTGVSGSSQTGIGVSGSSTNFVGINAFGGFSNPNTLQDFPALSITSNGNELIDACGPGGPNPCFAESTVFRVDRQGDVFSANDIFGTNVFANNSVGAFEVFSDGCVRVGFGSACVRNSVNVTGQYLINGSCVVGCPTATKTSSGKAVTHYVISASIPTTEDFGESQLVSGQAYVRLSPDFANTIDQRANYLVVVTAEGPSNGLYVARRTPAGFTVLENPGGHSTVMFSYRIMAKPYGISGTRLPVVTVMPHRARLPTQQPLHQ